MILEINSKITVYKFYFKYNFDTEFYFKYNFDTEFYFLFEHLTNTNGKSKTCRP